MQVVFLAKTREGGDSQLEAFAAVGVRRGHGVRRFDKRAFLDTDLDTASAVSPAALRFPVFRKCNDLLARSEACRLERPPAALDGHRHCYQEQVDGDGAVRKVYCIGNACAVLEEVDGRRSPARRPATALAGQAIEIGRWLDLEFYGLDFVGHRDDALTLIDVNPFPSFRGWREAPIAFWIHLEGTCGGVAQRPRAR